MKKQFINLTMCCFIIVIYISCGNNSDTRIKNPSSDETSTEWTKTLDEYESLVDKVNVLQTKVKSGDMYAAQEIGVVSKEMIDISNKCQQNQNSMSASEAKRLIDIMQKIKY